MAGMNVSGMSPFANVNPYEKTFEAGKVGRTDAIGQNQGECQTCKNRKYVDGSNEMDVSFKAPAHISPESSYGKVMAHEQMHVANARAEGAKEGQELVSANVTLKMERCPECGRMYTAGGLTTTVIRKSQPVYNDNPYDDARKIVDGKMLAGQKIDAEV
ncbi:MAG: hypothetical protein E7277_01125 [Lachnospiraceae bacterium]|nr:hypothetical protein [Lachnospiraceae bacterium]